MRKRGGSLLFVGINKHERKQDMANLGTLWFGADIDLTNLKQKIQQGNQEVLDALKLSYDPSSYQQMVSKLRSELSKEVFDVKIQADTTALQNIQQSLGGLGQNGNIAPFDTHNIQAAQDGVTSIHRQIVDFTKQILDQKDIVKNVSNDVAVLRDRWGSMVSAYGRRNSATMDAYNDYVSARKALREEQTALFALQQGRSRANLTLSEQRVAYREANEAVRQARKNLAEEKRVRIENTAALEREKAARKAIQADLEAERKKVAEIRVQQAKQNVARLQAHQAMRQQSQAAKELTNDSLRLNTTLAGGIHISTSLGSALSSLFAVDAARQFLENVIEIGGQLEMQRISIGAILDDVSHANELFGQIKDLAIKSPFGVIELDQYSKQLSAYGFQYNELYDMTKRLADISAGAGQDIGRLTLALGHVRSATYLTGITLRQFSMNNIPMLKMLADYYSELEHRAVSTAEVTKRISNKQVSYEDVVEQIYRMTDAGGKFYNMQEKVSTSLKAKFKNLKDSFDIMYGEIAESKIGDALKETAAILTSFARQWQKFVSILGAAATVFGSVKLAQFAFNQGLIVSNGLVKANAIATSQYTMAQLRSLATLKATNIQYLANAYGLTGMEKGLIRLKLVLLGTKNAFNGFVAILRSAMPYLATFAAISIAVDLFDEMEEKSRAEAQLLADITEKSTEGYRNMLEMRKKFAVGASGGMDNESLSMAIDDMVERLKDYSLTANSTFNNAFAVDEEGKSIHSLSEQYEILAKAVDDTTNAYKELNEIKPLIADALSKGEDYSGTILGEDVNRIIMRAGDKMFGWFTDWAIGKEFRAASMNFKDSMDFYVEAMNQASVAENKFLQSRMDIVSSLEKMGYKEVVDMDNEALLTFLTQMQYTAPYAFKKFSWSLKGDAKESLDAMLESWDKLGVASYNAESRMSDMGQTLYDALKASYNGKDVEEWADGWEETVLTAAHEATKGIQGFADLSKEAQNEIYNAFLKPFKITIDTNEAQERVNNLLVDLQNLVGRDWVVKIGVKGESSIDDAEAAIKAYKKAVADMQDTQQRLDKMQEEGKRGSEAYNQTMKDNLNAIKARDAALEIMKEYGVDIAKVDEEINKDKTKNTTKGKDTQLERAKTYFDEIKSFLDEYKKYVEVYGKDKSIDLLEKMFPTTKGNGKKIVENFKNVLLSIKNSLNLEGDARKKFGISIDKYIADFDLNEAKKVIDAALKDMQDYIASQSEKYNLYKALFEKTGSREFAEAAFADGRVWDEVAKQFEDSLKEITNGDIFDYDGYAGAAEEYYKGNKQAFELWKKIVEITRKNYNDALTKGADALAKQMTIEEKIVAAEERIAELWKKRNNETNREVQKSLDLQIGAASKEFDKLNYEKFQQSIEYLEFFGATLALTDSEVQKIGMDIKTMLLDELSNGTITAHDYAKTIKDVNERMEESSTAIRGTFGAFLQGGQKGIVNMRQNEVAKWATEVQKAQEDIEKAQREGSRVDMDAAMKRKEVAEKELEEASERLGISVKNLQTLVKMSNALQTINGALDGLQSVAQNLSDMFDALGKQDIADFWSDVSDSISGISSAFKPINNLLSNAMSGNVSGIVSSAISAPVEMFTAPITAFAKLHDKQMQREIEASKQREKEMQMLTKNLETALDRSLSGVYGLKATDEQMKKLEQSIMSWQTVVDKNSPIRDKNGMETGKYRTKRVYQAKSYMSEGTEEALQKAKETSKYYDVQYANLRAQQDEIRHQMEMEQGKKKSNASAIADYKQQIEEMEDEIKQFGVDMAKTLYDIDVHSWAQEFGDALFEAWKKGEDGAEAFKKKASEIIADVTQNIVSASIIGEALKPLEEFIAKEMERTSGELDPIAFAEGLADLLNTAFDKIGAVYEPTMDALNAKLQERGLPSMKEGESSGLSNGIKSITEETADILASYVNAMRADLSLVRDTQLTHLPIISEACMRGNILAEQQVREQRQIAANTLRNAEAAEMIYEILHGNVIGANKFAVA